MFISQGFIAYEGNSSYFVRPLAPKLPEWLNYDQLVHAFVKRVSYISTYYFIISKMYSPGEIQSENKFHWQNIVKKINGKGEIIARVYVTQICHKNIKNGKCRAIKRLQCYYNYSSVLKDNKNHSNHVLPTHLGSSINHVVKILGIFDPLPPFVVTFTK